MTEMESGVDDKAHEFIALRRFLFGEPPDIFAEFEELEAIDSPLRPAILVFKENLQSAFRVGCIPFQLVQSGVLAKRFSQIHAAERIRSLIPREPNEGLGPEQEKTALSIARERMEEELRDPDIIHSHAKETLSVLDRHLLTTDYSLSESADELLRQILVMAWGALETLVNDTIRILLNERPSLSGCFAESKVYRDILFAKTNIVAALEEHAFDISRVMGDIFCDVVKLDSLQKIQDVSSSLFCDGALDKELKNDNLWLLAQRRHLIVHRRGIVDYKYISSTTDTTPIGQRITLDASYIEASIKLVKGAGITFARASISKMRSTECSSALCKR